MQTTCQNLPRTPQKTSTQNIEHMAKLYGLTFEDARILYRFLNIKEVK